MWKNKIFENRPFRTKKYGIESLTYLAPKIWSLVHGDIENSATLNIFKSKITKLGLVDLKMPLYNLQNIYS